MSKRIESERITINCSSEKNYTFLSDFKNFTRLLPEQVSNWQCSGDFCSFEVKGLPEIGLRIIEKTPFTGIRMISEGKLPFNFTFNTFFIETAPQSCEVQLVIDSDMNPFIAVMAANPLQNFVDMLLSKLKEEMEK